MVVPTEQIPTADQMNGFRSWPVERFDCPLTADRPNSCFRVHTDGGREIGFARRGDIITVASDVFCDVSLAVPVGKLTAGARRFVIDLNTAINERLLELL